VPGVPEQRVKRKLLADIVSVTPSNFDDFLQCERRFLNRQLLGLPASDAGPANDTGMKVHDLLYFIHTQGSCADAAHVANVLAGHDADNDHIRQLVDRHVGKCPGREVTSEGHEVSLARFHRLPPPMFMATARFDAVWIHDGLLDARDYKTGRRHEERLADNPAARVQAFVLDQAARDRDLKLRLRYEYLNPDVDDDPEPWEPDADDLAAIENEIRTAVERMRAIDDWKGVADDRCTRCAYRSICRDSVAPSEPTWPVLVTGSDE
jgi:hypothetical protein